MSPFGTRAGQEEQGVANISREQVYTVEYVVQHGMMGHTVRLE